MQRILILLILFVSAGYLSANEHSMQQSNHGSVVCLHGFLRSYKSMIPVGYSLKPHGLRIYLWDYQSRKTTIEKHADHLVELLLTIAEERPGEPIHFVTHSLGGIIVRAALNHPACPSEAKIGKAVLLAPPNKGACLARHFRNCTAAKWIFGKGAGHQLLQFSEEDMISLGQFPETMEVMVIAGSKGSRFFRFWMDVPNDGKVTVEETRLDTPHFHHTLSVSHSWIMTSRESLKLIRYFLCSPY